MPIVRTILEVVVQAVDMESGFATARETSESNTEHKIFLPSHFGGNSAPYPSVQDTVKIQLSEDHRIVSAWR
jgi:hypothetical protein